MINQETISRHGRVSLPTDTFYSGKEVIRNHLWASTSLMQFQQPLKPVPATIPQQHFELRCGKCGQELPIAGQTLSPVRRREFVHGLRGALSHWRHKTGETFAQLARLADVGLYQINDLVNRPTTRDGPKDSAFYEKLYQVEQRDPGYLTPEVVRILRVLTNRYVE